MYKRCISIERVMNMRSITKAAIIFLYVAVLLFFLMGCTQTMPLEAGQQDDQRAGARSVNGREEQEKNASGPGELPAMKLSSPSFENNGMIPEAYTCKGTDFSPELGITDAPTTAQSLALVMDDRDASGFAHWIVWGIPPGTNTIPIEANIGIEGRNDFGGNGYRGPCPPSGTHSYVFRLYALDAQLPLNIGASKDELLQAMQGHVLAQAEIIGKSKK